MESLSLNERNIIKDIRNLFRLKKEQNDTGIKDVRNLFRLKKEIKGIKDIDILRIFFSMKKKKKMIISQ